MAIHPIWNDYPNMQNDLQATQKVMNQAVKIRNKKITHALQDFFESGGKLLRPAYFLLFAALGEDKPAQDKYKVAASIEILHAATLIHDDIIDNADLRRDRPTIQSTYGKDIAVYTGDFLFTAYFELVADGMNDFSAIKDNARSMRKILIGELDQMNIRYNTSISVKQYFQHIRGKTAQLFQLSCFQGAYFSHSSKRQQLLAQRIGHNIGMAFQILDDILDYSSNEEDFHKPVLEDVKQGLYTLPLILAMKANRQAFLPLLDKKTAMTDEDTEKVTELIHHYDGIAEAQKIADYFTQRALRDIKKLPDRPEKQVLIDVTLRLLQRAD